MRRREKRERKTGAPAKTPMQAANAHMEGYTGVPVFYTPHMHKQWPKWKQLLTGQRQEVPLFFNYEDLQQAWADMRQRRPKGKIPEQPEAVEVFNLWDVLSSMDQDANGKKKTTLQQQLITPFQKRFGKTKAADLADITFVPSSRSTQYKERISARGNGKARLRPMR